MLVKFIIMEWFLRLLNIPLYKGILVNITNHSFFITFTGQGIPEYLAGFCCNLPCQSLYSYTKIERLTIILMIPSIKTSAFLSKLEFSFEFQLQLTPIFLIHSLEKHPERKTSCILKSLMEIYQILNFHEM